MDPASLLVAEQVVSTTVEGAVVASIGLAQATQPLSATFTRITSEAFLPRSSHSINVAHGRAYIFGGEESPGKLAENDVHIVRIPSKKSRGDGEQEYKCVPALGEQEGEVPGARSGHTACVIGERMYIFGGRGKDMAPLKENGRVWVFDMNSLHWSFLDPLSGTYPPPRFHHGGVSSELPLPNDNTSATATYSEQIQSTIGKIPSLLGKGAPSREPHGTLFISSGSTGLEPLHDSWCFTVPSQTWSPLPSPPARSSSSPSSLALAHNRLYLISGSSDLGSEIQYLPLDKETYTDARGEGDLGLKAKTKEWTTNLFPTNPLAPGPRPRTGAGLVPVTTGNGREYLLYFFGEKASSTFTSTEKPLADKESRTYWSDTWSYQLPAQTTSAAGIKDATRSVMGIATGEATWAEVKIVTKVEGESLETEGKSHPGPRGWFGSAAVGKDVDGGDVVLWGGVNGTGETEGEGWLIGIK